VNFSFIQDKRYKAVYGEVSSTLEEASASVSRVKRSCQGFREDSLDDKKENGPERP
jgi:hypothetical protein